MSPSVHPRMSHSHEARGCNREWRPLRKWQQGHWPGGGSPWREHTWVKCTKVFWAKTAIATSEAEQSQNNAVTGGRKQLHPRPERWSSQVCRQIELNTCETFWGPCEEGETGVWWHRVGLWARGHGDMALRPMSVVLDSSCLRLKTSMTVWATLISFVLKIPLRITFTMSLSIQVSKSHRRLRKYSLN